LWKLVVLALEESAAMEQVRWGIRMRPRHHRLGTGHHPGNTGEVKFLDYSMQCYLARMVGNLPPRLPRK
jgi:hypothetical protein